MGKIRVQGVGFHAAFLDNQIVFRSEHNEQGAMTGIRGVNQTTDRRGEFYVWQGPLTAPTARWPQSGTAKLLPGQDTIFNTPPNIDPDDWNWTFYTVAV